MILPVLLFQAEVVGQSIGDGIMKLILMVLAAVGVIGGIILFLWLVRKADKKINN